MGRLVSRSAAFKFLFQCAEVPISLSPLVRPRCAPGSRGDREMDTQKRQCWGLIFLLSIGFQEHMKSPAL